MRNTIVRTVAWSLWIAPVLWALLRLFILHTGADTQSNNALESVDHAALTVFVVAVLELLLHEHTKADLTTMLQDGLMNPAFFPLKSPQEQLNYLKQLARTINPSTAADVTTEFLFWPALRGYKRLRDSRFFEFIIRDAQKDFVFHSADSKILDLPARDYFLRLCTSEFVFVPDSLPKNNEPLYIAFCINSMQHLAAHKDSNCIFRLQIPLQPSDSLRFDALFSNSQRGTINIGDAIVCSLSLDHVAVAPEATAVYDPNIGIKLAYPRLRQEMLRHQGEKQECSFSIHTKSPHWQGQKFLTSVWSEPTRVNVLSYRFESEQITNVHYNSYLTVDAIDRIQFRTTDRRSYGVDLHGHWIFPVSGVVFLWD